MTTEILHALLQAWPATEAARLIDQTGAVLAQNAPASIHAENAAFWCDEAVHHRELGAKLWLQTRAVTTAENPVDTDKPIEIQALSRGITHELRNPLAAIITAIGLVQDDPGASDETRLLLSVVRKESQRMNRILTEFSAYVKPRAPRPATFDATQTLREVVREVSRDGLADRAEIPIEIHDVLPEVIMAHADEEHFRDVLRQVMHNAIEAMPNGGYLHLASEKSDHKVLFIISDSGGGFSAEGLQRAFQPFFSSKSQSTGLGLSIARSAVEASGGHIWIDNHQPDTTKSATSSTIDDAAASSASTFTPFASIASGAPVSSNGHSGARVCIELPAAVFNRRQDDQH